jgi:hypothetical protein
MRDRCDSWRLQVHALRYATETVAPMVDNSAATVQSRCNALENLWIQCTSTVAALGTVSIL